MTLSESTSGNESWELGDKLLLAANEINSYATNREGDYVSLKVSNMLGKLAAKYAGTPVLIDAPNLLIPEEQGIGLGPGQMSGEILGFTFSDYATIDDSFESVSNTGVVMAFEIDKLNGVSTADAKAWRNIVFPEIRSPRFVVGMPIIQGNKVMELTRTTATPDSVESLLEPNEESQYAYREYVERVQSFMKGRYLFSQYDAALETALQQEMTAMNFNCSFLGNAVGVQANYMRRPKADGSDNFTIIKGGIVGRLRKFIYAPTVLNGNVVGDVQAVIYDFDVAEAISIGLITPEEADRHPSTTYVPLSRQHVMLDLETKKE